jgi:hypothetical protein
MAIPFYIPDDSQPQASAQNLPQNSVSNTPSRPNSDPQNYQNQNTPQQPAIDSEVLVQAFYEALCRCSQGKLYYCVSFIK